MSEKRASEEKESSALWYPTTAAEWRDAIDSGLRLPGGAGADALKEGSFPYDQLSTWIERTFSDGFSPEFVPALLRNSRGLTAWAYGNGPEPFWPESDEAIT